MIGSKNFAEKAGANIRINNRRSGQAMLIAVLSLGGAILGATTVAGLLILYQIRATTDSENSAKAIFAADSGIEWVEFGAYCSLATPPKCGGGAPAVPQQPTMLAGSGAALNIVCYAGLGATTTCDGLGSTSSSVSTGASLNTKRAFFISLSASTTTYP